MKMKKSSIVITTGVLGMILTSGVKEVHASSVNLKQVTGVKANDSLNVRSISDYNNILDKLSNGETVEVLGNISSNPGWIKVKTKGGVIGMCNGVYLKEGTTSNSNIYYTKMELNLRTGAGTMYPVFKKVPVNTSLEVLKFDYSNGWAQVKYNGKVLYCSSSYLTKTQVNSLNSANKQGDIYVVNTDGLKVRTKPSTTSNVYKELRLNTQVEVVTLNHGFGWSEIKLDGKTFYTANRHLTLKKDSTSNSSVSNQKEYKKVADFTTKYSIFSPSKANIELACKKIDGIVIKNGQTFSYLNSLGNITKANGFVESTIIVNGKVSTGVGGGVCQISTTLGNAVLKAGIKPTSSRNHSKKSTYVGRGLDFMVATTEGAKQDFTFKNNTGTDLVISAKASKGVAKVEILSNGDVLKGYKYETEVEVLGPLTVNTYLKKIKDGKVISKDFLFKRTYVS